MTIATKGLYILGSYELIYGPDERADIGKLVDIYAPPQTVESVQADRSVLADVEVILSGWGGPKIDEEFLADAPRLRAVFYGAGSIHGIVTDAFWDRGVIICGGWGANAVAVGEYALSQILWCLKMGWDHARTFNEGASWAREDVPGGYQTTVGIVSLGQVCRQVCRLLKAFDVKTIAYDPFATDDDAKGLDVELCPLDDLFRRANVVSLHTPALEQTRGMITGEHIASMKRHAALINTSRGMVIRENEMIDVLAARDDLQAVLDVTDPEPPAPDSPLRTMPNVVLTPHIAGAMGRECNRMGRCMADELSRYLDGRPLQYQITREMLPGLA